LGWLATFGGGEEVIWRLLYFPPPTTGEEVSRFQPFFCAPSRFWLHTSLPEPNGRIRGLLRPETVRASYSGGPGQGLMMLNVCMRRVSGTNCIHFLCFFFSRSWGAIFSEYFWMQGVFTPTPHLGITITFSRGSPDPVCVCLAQQYVCCQPVSRLFQAPRPLPSLPSSQCLCLFEGVCGV